MASPAPTAGPQPAQPPVDVQQTTAHTVGSQFVQQYFTVLHANPKHLHRFYSDNSCLTHADVGPAGVQVRHASGQKAISDLVSSLGYEETGTEVYTVDSQFSSGGGVVVQVTGALQLRGRPKRPFVQTFFLATQEKGYYVLNDIFRRARQPGGSSANSRAGAADAAPTAAAATTAAAAITADTKPLSYAERLRQGRSTPGSPQKRAAEVQRTSTPEQQQQAAGAAGPLPAAPAPAAGPGAAAGAGAGERGGSSSEGGRGEGRGGGSEARAALDEHPENNVFIRNIPGAITQQELHTALGRFGPVRKTDLKIQRGKESYAFVYFEGPEAAQAVMATGLEVGGIHLPVVAKRPYIFRPAANGGRALPGGPGGANGGPYGPRPERGYRGGRGRERGAGGERPPYPAGPADGRVPVVSPGAPVVHPGVAPAAYAARAMPAPVPLGGPPPGGMPIAGGARFDGGRGRGGPGGRGGGYEGSRGGGGGRSFRPGPPAGGPVMPPPPVA
eukprot:scaffold3.g6761.t1